MFVISFSPGHPMFKWRVTDSLSEDILATILQHKFAGAISRESPG